jgi:hypothetical protein
MLRGALALLTVLALGCSTSASPAPQKPTPKSTTQVRMTFERGGAWLTAPFPSDDLKKADGTIDVSAYPNPDKLATIDQVTSLVGAAHGFSQSGGVFFTLTGPLDPNKLPSLSASVEATSPVFLVSVDAKAPDYLKRYPVNVSFKADGGVFAGGIPPGTPGGGQNLLSVVPLQGLPMRAGTTYAAVVLAALGDAMGLALEVSTSMAELASGETPAGMSQAAHAEYAAALASLATAGLRATDIAGIAVFTTDTALDAFQMVKDAMLALPLPKPTAPWTLTDTFPTYCVYQSVIGMPDYEAGTPPFQNSGGQWTFDAEGKPILQRTDPSTLYATVPRAAMPASGFPTTVFIRTGAGGNRPIVDRGRADSMTYSEGGQAVTPGTGPALYFANEGFAGLQVDGPLGGLRNPMNLNEDFLIFNVTNLPEMRDSIRESAVELVLFAHIAASLSFDASDCTGFSGAGSAGGGLVKFDMSHAGLMGHSMGSTISPLAFAFEPTYKNLILSGAGASWMANILYKELPLPVLPLVDILLGYPAAKPLTMGDPMLSMVQWALEPADPLIYTDSILHSPVDAMNPGPPRNVLMEQGIVDHYILPPIANGTSLSLGLDLAGTELDDTVSALSQFTPLGTLLPLSGGRKIALPAHAVPPLPQVTAIVVQHLSDGIEDGHEIVFQEDPPKHEYECFLKTSLDGVPTVPNGGDPDAGCP